MKSCTAATINKFSLKIAMLLSLVFAISANAQLIECKPVRIVQNFISNGKTTKFDCKKEECAELKIDIEKCEKSSSFYKCFEDKSDDAYMEKILTTINRMDATAIRKINLQNLKTNNYSEFTKEYESCEISKAVPKL